MTQILWDQAGEREFETGVDHGVLYLADSTGDYVEGYGWSGLTTVTESPSGAEVTKKYADNINYISLISAEVFEGTIAAFTYPDEWEQCDGSASPSPGVSVGQQSRRPFGFSYRTKVGNDLEGQDYGYKLHLAWGGLASPSERAYGTVNDSPDAIEFSWKFTTTPVAVDGLKPTALIVIDSTQVDADSLAALELVLYGSVGVDPRLPSPTDVLAFFSGAVTTVTPNEPSYDDETGIITIPTQTGVVYKIGGVVQSAGATEPIEVGTLVTAQPTAGYVFTVGVDSDWYYAAPV